MQSTRLPAPTEAATKCKAENVNAFIHCSLPNRCKPHSGRHVDLERVRRTLDMHVHQTRNTTCSTCRCKRGTGRRPGRACHKSDRAHRVRQGFPYWGSILDTLCHTMCTKEYRDGALWTLCRIHHTKSSTWLQAKS